MPHRVRDMRPSPPIPVLFLADMLDRDHVFILGGPGSGSRPLSAWLLVPRRNGLDFRKPVASAAEANPLLVIDLFKTCCANSAPFDYDQFIPDKGNNHQKVRDDSRYFLL
jgi:hypothetical protein